MKRYEENYPEVSKHIAYLDLLRDASVEATVIATPAETHYALTKEVLWAGKDLFVEKPLCLEESQAAELRELCWPLVPGGEKNTC